MTDQRLGYLFIMLAMLIWGSIGIVVRIIPYSAELIVFYRVLFAFSFLVILAVVTERELKLTAVKDNKVVLMVSGVALSLNWIFFFQAIKTTTVANATLSYYMAPIIATLLSSLWLNEKLTKKGIIALGISFLGIGIIVSSGASLEVNNWQGIGYGLLAALFYALFTVLNKSLVDLSAYTLTLIQTGISVLVLMPVVWDYQYPGGQALLWLILLGIVHTGGALILYLKGLSLSKIQDVGVLSYLDPVSAIILAFIFLGEIPTLVTLIGGSLILASSYLIVKS